MIASEAPLLGRRRAVDEKRKQPLLHDRRLLLVPALVLARVLIPARLFDCYGSVLLAGVKLLRQT